VHATSEGRGRWCVYGHTRGGRCGALDWRVLVVEAELLQPKGAYEGVPRSVATQPRTSPSACVHVGRTSG
jgi:hypothetical protein